MAPTWSPSVVSVVGPVGLFLVLLARGCLAEGKGGPEWVGLAVHLLGDSVCRSLARGFQCGPIITSMLKEGAWGLAWERLSATEVTMAA